MVVSNTLKDVPLCKAKSSLKGCEDQRKTNVSIFTSAKADVLSGDSRCAASAFLKMRCKTGNEAECYMSAVYRCQHLDKHQRKLRSINWRPTFSLISFSKNFSEQRV